MITQEPHHFTVDNEREVNFISTEEIGDPVEQHDLAEGEDMCEMSFGTESNINNIDTNRNANKSGLDVLTPEVVFGNHDPDVIQYKSLKNSINRDDHYIPRKSQDGLSCDHNMI